MGEVADFDVQSGPGRVFVTGELDMSVAPQLQEALHAAAVTDGCEVMIDLTRVTFVDSSGLNEFLRLTNKGHEVVIRGAAGPVRRTIELVGLDQVFMLED
jgi:anti-sigma B factor antagonist